MSRVLRALTVRSGLDLKVGHEAVGAWGLQVQGVFHSSKITSICISISIRIRIK